MSKLIDNFISNSFMLHLLETIHTKNWLNRSCLLQGNWDKTSDYFEYSPSDGIYFHFLYDEKECYLNIQNFEEEQIPKSIIRKSRKAPIQLYNFILDEPIISQGTTNYLWVSMTELKSSKPILDENEKSALEILFASPNLEKIRVLFSKKYKNKITDTQFNFLLEIIQKRVVNMDVLQNNFDKILNKVQIEDIKLSGIKIE